MTSIEPGFRPILRNAPLAGIGLITLTLACWGFFFAGSGMDMDVREMSSPGIPPISGQTGKMGSNQTVSTLPLLLMWSTMMLAMMMPGTFRYLPAFPTGKTSATQTLLCFWLGYTCIWFGFSVLATGLQYFLVDIGMVHGMKMWSSDSRFSTALLTIAGLYQFTGLKARCQLACHAVPAGPSPLGNGLEYGRNCLLSSLPLMLLLFVGGVMNVYWVVLLTALVTIEKTTPHHRLFRIATGIACLGAGIGKALA